MNNINDCLTEREKITWLENEFLTAIQSGHLATLEELLHNDQLFLKSQGQTITKQMDLTSHHEGTMFVEELTPTIEQINVINFTAVVMLVSSIRREMLGTPIHATFRYMRIGSHLPENGK